MGATRSRRTSTCADFLISATSSASPTGSTRRCGTCLPATPSRPGSERVRRGTPLTYLVTAAVLAVSGLLGIWGFRGSPLLDTAAARNYARPAWAVGLPALNSYPAYRPAADGTAIPVGRAVMLDDERIEMRLFPDLRNVSFEGSHVVMLETDVKALWSLVPATSKADIGKVGERLISLLRDRLVSIIGQIGRASCRERGWKYG